MPPVWGPPGAGAPNRRGLVVAAAVGGLAVVAAVATLVVVLASRGGGGSGTSTPLGLSTSGSSTPARPTPTPHPSASTTLGSGSLVVPDSIAGENRNTDPTFNQTLQSSADQLRAAGATGAVIAAYGNDPSIPSHLVFAAAGAHDTSPTQTRQLVDKFDEGAHLTLVEASMKQVEEAGVSFTCWQTQGSINGAVCAWNETQTFGMIYQLTSTDLQSCADFGAAARQATLGQS